MVPVVAPGRSAGSGWANRPANLVPDSLRRPSCLASCGAWRASGTSSTWNAATRNRLDLRRNRAASTPHTCGQAPPAPRGSA